MSHEDTLQQAVQHHQSGNLQEASYLYRAILEQFTDVMDIVHDLKLALDEFQNQHTIPTRRSKTRSLRSCVNQFSQAPLLGRG